MSFSQGRDSGSDEVESPDVLCQRVGECLRHVACGIVVLSEVGCLYTAFYIAAKIGTPRVAEGFAGSTVYFLAFAELNLTAVEQTGDAAEGEHQVEVFGPCDLRLGKSLALRCSVWGIVVGVYIDDVHGGVVVVLVALADAPG